MKFYVVGILGSPRPRSNTELLLDRLLSILASRGMEVEKIRLRDYHIEPCNSCRYCLRTGECRIEDDMKKVICPKLVRAHVIVVATPVHFDNVSTLTKTFMDRTWPLRGKLKNKVLGCIVVGRGYGLDSALTCIHNWGLKHRMILGDRGVAARGFDYGEVLEDERGLKDLEKHAERLIELVELIHHRTGLETRPSSPRA